jgi:hypothetical protein
MRLFRIALAFTLLEALKKKFLHPGEKLQKKVQFLLIDGSFTESIPVESRKISDLREIPVGAVACQFYEEWPLVFLDGSHTMIQGYARVRMSRMTFFRAVGGELPLLLENGLISETEYGKLLTQGHGYACHIVIAHTQDLSRKMILCLDRSDYSIVNGVPLYA